MYLANTRRVMSLGLLDPARNARAVMHGVVVVESLLAVLGTVAAVWVAVAWGG